MVTNNTQQTTFWQFLQKHKIEIPIIQRDYAQGRKGKEKLREKFLDDLKGALDTNHVLKLDFVYGSVENDNLNPLDGQQRLTTLWLLHWYIACKAGKLAENKDIFKKFTYETRVSSREFCKKLSDFTEQQSTEGIVKHITNQTWFFSAWKQDPTIQAMLNMLGGTEAKEKDKDIKDGIEELLGDLENKDYNAYWEKLTNSDCPIIFYYLPLYELKLSDDLYIKMNARGKQLTSFENFKADLVGYIKSEGWEQDKNPQQTIAYKLDTTWTDIFWENKSNENKIDDIYFTFLNRYFLNALITAEQDDSGKLLSADKIEENKTFGTIYGNQSNDSNVKYNSFDVYRNFNKESSEKLTKTLDNFKNESIVDCFPDWVDKKDKFDFIPKYGDNSITTLTQSQRVVFHAVCRYFEKTTFSEITFKQWMRVVWNIVENANISGVESMIGAIRLIDELGVYSHDIYNHLKNRDIEEKDFASEQMKEEKEKARQIIDNSTENWEEKIMEAEMTAFFKGAVRFMFTKEDGAYDWSLFDDRFEKSKVYFDEKGVADGYKKDALLLRVLVSKFSEWNNFTDIHYDNNISTWKNDLLISKKQISPVCQLFNEPDVNSLDLALFTSPLTDTDKIKLFHEDLVKTPLLSKIEPGCTFHWWNYGGRYSLYPYNTKSQSKIYVLADKRNEVFSKLNIESPQKIDGTPFFRGWEIYFKYNEKEYQWWNVLKEKNENGEWGEIKDITLDNLEKHFNK